MKTHISANEATYGPQQYKTFAGALTAFFSEECPQLGGMRTRQVLTATILSMVGKFHPETSHLKQGQTPYDITKHWNFNFIKIIFSPKITQTIVFASENKSSWSYVIIF